MADRYQQAAELAGDELQDTGFNPASTTARAAAYTAAAGYRLYSTMTTNNYALKTASWALSAAIEKVIERRWQMLQILRVQHE